MYTSEIPQYVIDLGLPEAERWVDVIRAERDVGMRFTNDCAATLRMLPSFARRLIKTAYKWSGGRYVDEIEAIATRLDLKMSDVLAMQCSYELSHASGYLFGCTAGVRFFPQHGPVHVRNLDWPIASFGDATCIFRFVKGTREFIAVGVVGYVGVLSGMLPGAYSITINYAPTSAFPGFDFGPSFLVRDVLETCDTYDEAVYALENTALAAPCFFTVCGAKDGESCVVERGRNDAQLRSARDSVITQANHHVSRPFAPRNAPFLVPSEDGGTVVEFSTQRADMLEEQLRKLPKGASLEQVASVLDVPPVLNDDTYQMMLFAPKTGEWRAWRWVND